MGRLYWFNLKQAVRNKNEMFWSLLFPLILGTLFGLTFGKGSSMMEKMNPIPVAVVKEGNAIFETFLHALDEDTIALTEMEEDEAEAALKEGTIEGIFYSRSTPALSVSGVQIQESILTALLEGYLQNQQMMEKIGEKNPLGLLKASGTISDYRDYIGKTGAGGNELDDTLSYFFALISMACLFGAFTGMTTAVNLRADQSALAARRSVAPTGRLKLVISEMLADFTILYLNICVLLLYLHFVLGISFGDKWPMLIPVCVLGSMTGIAWGIFIGSLRIGDGCKIGLLVGSSLVMSFLSGLMFGGMKYILEKHMPILNRINPAALIADAFYSISVYENISRYRMNLILLGVITAALVLAGFLKLRRERYDSL